MPLKSIIHNKSSVFGDSRVFGKRESIYKKSK